MEAWQGQGAYGAVYRAVRIGQEQAGPVAFKLSLLPWNERFVREAALLLIDFGSGHFQGAKRLTWQLLAPGTPDYLSPQACLFDIRLTRHRDSY